MARLRPFRLIAGVALLTVALTTAAGAAQTTPSPVLSPLPAMAPMPSPARVVAALTGPARATTFGTGLAGEVVDAQTGAVLWSRSATTPEMVASTQKLLVAAAVLGRLGASASAVTSLRSAGVVSGGVLAGDLYLRGGGDVLLAAATATGWPARTSLDALAAGLAARGVRAVHGAIIADGSAFAGATTAPGWKPTYVTQGSVAPVTGLEVNRGTQPGTEARAPDPDAQAAQLLRAALARHGITVTGGARDGVTPASARVLAQVAGPPAEVGIQEMLQNSDNDAAESYGRQLALATGRPATFAGAAAAIIATLAAARLPTTGVSLADASGLSRDDRVTPQLLVAVLRAAATSRTDWRPILEGLPVAAFSGTLIGRDRGPAGTVAAGIVRAKTGNISGVTAVAGTVVDADGRQLVFSFVTDTSGALTQTEAALDMLAAALVPL
jgi:D-alanyl-D-alanine carboxypeptidase/D-alanyl-D-alanine-endopeptidase (penicillin-binding protein 4)